LRTLGWIAALNGRPAPRPGEEEVTYQKFEAWWKERLGIVDANIPVLPEFMVQKIDEAHYFDRKRNGGGCPPLLL
jgi:hypothetical protein